MYGVSGGRTGWCMECLSGSRTGRFIGCLVVEVERGQFLKAVEFLAGCRTKLKGL